MTNFDFPKGTRLYAESGAHSLEIVLLADTDLDSTFDARCLLAGDVIRINGWLWTFEPMDDQDLGLPYALTSRGSVLPAAGLGF